MTPDIFYMQLENDMIETKVKYQGRDITTMSEDDVVTEAIRCINKVNSIAEDMVEFKDHQTIVDALGVRARAYAEASAYLCGELDRREQGQ